MSVLAAAERLTEAQEALADLQHADLGIHGDLRQVPQLNRIFDAFDALVAAGETESVIPAYMEIYEPATGDLRTILDLVSQRINDGVFLTHKAPGMRVFRSDFVGTGPILADADIELARAGDALVPRGARSGESNIVSLLADLQLFVAIEGDDSWAAGQARDRPLDPFGLIGTLAVTYSQRLERRLLWGSGSCTLTNQRLLGMLFSDEVDGRPQTAETAAMPSSVVAKDGSSAVVFAVERSQFERREVTAGRGVVARYFMSRLPTLNLIGSECDVVIEARRVVRSNGVVERPSRDEIDNAVVRFCARADD